MIKKNGESSLANEQYFSLGLKYNKITLFTF